MTVFALDDHVAEIDPDANVDAPLYRDAIVAFGHPALEDDRTLDCICNAAELRQQSVAHQLEDAPAVLVNLGLEQLSAVHPELSERIRLILLHQPGVAHDIRGKDGGKVALGAFFSHWRDCRKVLPIVWAVR